MLQADADKDAATLHFGERALHLAKKRPRGGGATARLQGTPPEGITPARTRGRRAFDTLSDFLIGILMHACYNLEQFSPPHVWVFVLLFA